MKLNIKPIVALPVVLLLTASPSAPRLTAQDTGEPLVVARTVNAAEVIPIAVTGFSGEVDKVLKFDLEVIGCKVVGADTAKYLVTGSNNGNLQGFLQDGKTKANLLSKAYTGGNARVQAHTFADEIAGYLRGTKPIFLTQIAFKLDKGAAKEICVADFDGHNAREITRDGAIVAAPSWRPGSRVIYYNSYKDGFPGIYAHDLNAGTRLAVAKHAGSNISPAASRNGKVAMILSKGGSPNLYVADADGSNLRQLTKTREGESSPCWSPDGQSICFVSRRDGGKALFVISAAGGEMRRLRFGGTEPDWSPDGKTIVFTTQAGNSFNICTLPAGGGDVTPLVSGEDPSWAPNSRTVIFARRTGAGMRVLSLLDVPTKQVKDAAQISGSASQPSWAR
jgi:TolB protein